MSGEQLSNSQENNNERGADAGAWEALGDVEFAGDRQEKREGPSEQLIDPRFGGWRRRG